MRDVERRIDHAGRMSELSGWWPTLDESNLTRPAGGILKNLTEHLQLTCAILVLVFQTDVTRVCTLRFNDDISYLQFPHLGDDIGHHDWSYGNHADLLKVNQFFMDN